MAEFEGFSGQKREILLECMPQFLKKCSLADVDNVFRIFCAKQEELTQKKWVLQDKINQIEQEINEDFWSSKPPKYTRKNK